MMQFITAAILAAFVGYAGSWYFGVVEGNFDDYRVLLLDQRGTGRSSPITRQTLPARGEPAAQADYLTHFRADAIVRALERHALAWRPSFIKS